MIKWLKEITENDFELVGGKAYNLSHMISRGINIPDGFVITSDAYEEYINGNNLNQKIRLILKSNKTSFEKSKEIQSLFVKDKISIEIKNSILKSFVSLNANSVAVRSSSTAEDLDDASFAGQYNTYLNVKKFDLLDKIVKCWRSLWNENAIDYRYNHSVTDDFSHCVLIQEMVNSTVSGVVFTVNPVNDDRNEMLINASYGLGEGIVSGKVNPDQFIINRDSNEVIKEVISNKELMCVNEEDGIAFINVDGSKVNNSCLSEEQIRQLVRESLEIEKIFNNPQDIEFGFENETLFVLQSRSITTLFPIDSFEKDGKLRAYLAASSVMLGMKEAFTPLGADLYGGMYPAMINMMARPKKDVGDDIVKYEACRIFVDITYLLSSKFVSKQLGKAFSGSDLPLEATVNALIDEHGRTFTNQGIRFKIPFGISKYGLDAMKKYKLAHKVKPEEKNRMIKELGIKFYENITFQSKYVNTPEERWKFCEDIMIQAFELTQNQAWYCVEVNNYKRIEKAINKCFPNKYNLDVLSYSFPDCVTVEFNIELNKLAEYYDENNISPSIDDGKMVEFLDKYGHRATIELDFGYQRWNEDPRYLINQINSYIENKNYEKNLRDIEVKAKMANDMMDDIHNEMKKLKGKRKADKLKCLIKEFRRASGMREYPKYNIVQGLDVARKVMLEQGELYSREGLLESAEDIFFLNKEQILTGTISKEIVQNNKNAYEREMQRNSIPRIVLNTGKTYYTAKVFDKNSTVIEGIPLSSGVCEGEIKIVTDPLNADLNEGEIMMAESTNPAWTPLFMISGGLILEYGGPLSHGGIVARELGIPAVVGISTESGMLKNGQKVRIHGDTGVVEIIE